MEKKFKEEIILYVVNKALKDFGYDKIDRLQVVKILYLLDRLMKQEAGNKISDYEYILERLGPYSREIIIELTSLVRRGALSNTESYYEYTISNLLESDLEKIKKVEQAISNMNTEKIAAGIIGIFELARNLTQLLDEVHNLEEVKNGKIGKVVL